MKEFRKIKLSVFGVIAVLLVITAIPVWAFQGNVGSSPYAAALLVSGLNTGRLDPGQEYWYAYSRLDLGDPAYNAIILGLNFEAEGNAVASRVNFQVFTFEQVEAWLKDNSGPLDNLGLGTPASADFDANTGERLWTGFVAEDDVYYVRIFNLSPSPIRFRLTALGQKNGNVEGFMDVGASIPVDETAVIPAAVTLPGPAATKVEINPASAPAAAPLPPLDDSPASTSWLLAAQAIQGLPPQEAAAWLMSAARLGWLPGSENGSAAVEAAAAPASVPPLMPVNPNPRPPLVIEEIDAGEPEVVAAAPVGPAAEAGPDPHTGDSIYPNRPLKLLDSPNVGRLAPKSEHWYTFTPAKFDDKWIENFSLTMFFTPGEPNLARHVTFELFTGGQYHIWERGTPDDMEHFGAGSWISRDGDYMTGERLWHGTVVDGDQYFVKITNGTGKWIDYYLLPGDIINTELGALASTQKAAPADSAETGQDIGSPVTFQKGQNSGSLPAGQDIWFSFRTPDTNKGSFDFLPYSFELNHQGGPGKAADGINVEIYPFQDQQIWQRGEADAIIPLGVGSYAGYNEPADQHRWLWNGHLVSNTVYFIRINNASSEEIVYDLIIKRHPAN